MAMDLSWYGYMNRAVLVNGRPGFIESSASNDEYDHKQMLKGVKSDSRKWEITTNEWCVVVDRDDIKRAKYESREPKKILKLLPVTNSYFGSIDILECPLWEYSNKERDESN